MIKSILIATLFMGSSVLFSAFYIGYPTAGKTYIKKHREQRKSLRHGSGVYIYGSRGFRGGK